MKDADAQDKQDAELAEAEALEAQALAAAMSESADDDAGVPASDPEAKPTVRMVTAVQLFLDNFLQVFGAFKAAAGAKTVKVEPTVALIELAANHAAFYTNNQIQQLMAEQARAAVEVQA